MQNIDEDKELYRFIKHIEFIRGYFKDGDWVEFANSNYVHENGITRKEAELMYEKECEKLKKHNSILGRVKSAITRRVNMILDDNYKTLLDLMDILHKDYIDEKDLDNILINAESFYNSYFRGKEIEELENN